MRKRLLALILGAAMVTTMLAGCGSSSSDSATAPRETTESSDTTEASDTSDADATDETTAAGASLAEQAIAERKAEGKSVRFANPLPVAQTSYPEAAPQPTVSPATV